MEELNEKALEKMWKFIVETMSFDVEETAAIEHQVPMTQEMFEQILDKCGEVGFDLDDLFHRMLVEHQELVKSFADKISEQIRNIEVPKVFEEEKEKRRNKLFAVIRANSQHDG